VLSSEFRTPDGPPKSRFGRAVGLLSSAQLSDEEPARTFQDNATGALPEERAAEVAALTLALPDAEGVDALTALRTPAG
jgi:hypothetical protein